ncbi:MAG: CRTAC1 family protein, partial [Acidobacteriota bacterium]|nr:CRTAC1 family protein [Acidobacteriota bacterium]
VYRAQPDRLFRNRGDGSFVDVTATALASTTFGPALGVATADFDGDGWLDIYVANDGEENQLWMNRRDGTLADAGLVSGAALNGNGAAEGSMGVDAGDFDNDGDEDLFMTHLTTETNTLYVNDGNGMFEDRSALSGLGPPSLAATGFGTAWLDFDNDGWLDVLTVNGRVSRTEERADEPFPYDQPRQLFRNLGDGRFEEVTARAGATFAVSEVGRGAAFGDVDNDGNMDVLVGNDSGRVRLLVNQVENTHHWLGLRLVGGVEAPRDMPGARVEVATSAGTTLWRRARADGSYGSANDPRVHVGLGDATAVSRIRVHWPGGRVEEWTDVPVDRWTTLTEGSGR